MELRNTAISVSDDSAIHRRVRARGEEVRGFILANVEKNPGDITHLVAERFEISRQAANKHIKNLVTEGALLTEGRTRYRKYRLAALSEWRVCYQITPELEEDQAWARDISVALGNLPRNVMDIWHFCVTEMFNNAVDHSTGKSIYIDVAKTAANTQVLLMDDGVGIFRKIQQAMSLADERQAILELAKGKLTTDPKGHTGQGIFFTSRLLDSFDILSGGVFYTHAFGENEDWILERPDSAAGTTVFMKLSNHSARTDKQIFDQFSSGDDYGFTKTVVPVRLAQYGDDKLISRSQAKRLLARLDRFKTVLFDFKQVEGIGQAFADEIFRVFAQGHPDITIIPINASTEVQQMVNAARSQWAAEINGI
jgi:anti-sigma regulatory factor (Ser/Thr protein kinase)/biotin operon repressor